METNNAATASEVMYRGFVCRKVEGHGWKIVMGDEEYLYPSIVDAQRAINGMHEDCVKKYWGARIKSSNPSAYSAPQSVPIAPAVQRAYQAQEKPKGRISGCIAMILTFLYTLFLLTYFADTGMDSLGNYIATQIAMPHMLCVALAAIFSAIGFFGKQRWAVLTAAILMSVAAVLMLDLAPMVVIQAALFFVSYARAK